MPQVGLESMIPVSEWAKMVRVLYCVATVIGIKRNANKQNS
jgi:hypothetical protein